MQKLDDLLDITFSGDDQNNLEGKVDDVSKPKKKDGKNETNFDGFENVWQPLEEPVKGILKAPKNKPPPIHDWPNEHAKIYEQGIPLDEIEL